MTCPHCGREFPSRYICHPKVNPVGGAWAGAAGWAKANYQRHLDNCKRRKEGSS